MKVIGRNPAQRLADRQLITRYRLQGVPLRQIPALVGLSLTTVKRELRAATAEWRSGMTANVEELAQRELQRLELLEANAWSEWERSRLNYVKVRSERITPEEAQAFEAADSSAAPAVALCGPAGAGPLRLLTRETGNRVGDARFLQVILSAHERRCKILGIDAPVKVAPTDPTGEKPYAAMADAELAARIAELQSKKSSH